MYNYNARPSAVHVSTFSLLYIVHIDFYLYIGL